MYARLFCFDEAWHATLFQLCYYTHYILIYYARCGGIWGLFAHLDEIRAGGSFDDYAGTVYSPVRHGAEVRLAVRAGSARLILDI